MPMEASGKLRRSEGGGGALAAHGGFTLIELMVVMGIMVLLLALAAPALKIITGSRSTEAAQNLISATLGRARNEAIGMQATRGVAIYYDATVGQTMMAVVYFPTAGVMNIDVVPEEEAMPLPVGVDVASINDDAATRYFLADNPAVTTGTGVAITSVVILFDGNGQFVKTTYAIASGSELARRMGSTYTYPISGNYSQFGFALCDREQLRSVDTSTNWATWIDDNTTPLVVNRYNGTLIEGK